MNDPQDYPSRAALYEAGLHNSYMRGIGRAKDGSGLMSIVLSGGYIDDEDSGDEIVYTGEGGRDSVLKVQVADQTLEAGNLDLLRSFESSQPVYVTRGSGHKSPLSPKSGYTFFGKYYIQKHWIEKGRDGFDIIRFKLTKEPDYQTIAPEEDVSQNKRVSYTSQRIVRDTKIAVKVKEAYDYACQICGVVINLPSGGKYAEGAHIKPLGTPHNGPDRFSNILCLCPNHHVMFDFYAISIDPETLTVLGLENKDTKLRTIESHKIDKEYLSYHWDNYKKHLQV